MPQKQKSEKPQCHIHDKIRDYEVEEIRRHVCVNDLPLIEYSNEMYYCLFHLPSKEKDAAKFNEIFYGRLNTVETNIFAMHQDVKHDFRYVWFPDAINLSNRTFSKLTDFSHATFSAFADFNLTTFSFDADFTWAIFSAGTGFSYATFSARVLFVLAVFSADAYFKKANFRYASFWLATFSAEAEFDETTFSADAHFSQATFSAVTGFSHAAFCDYVDFRSAIFFADTDFNQAIFSANANFKSAKFEENAQVFFHQTRFYQIADFGFAIFTGYADFAGDDLGEVFKEKDAENKEALLNLQNARLEKPERISFHRVRLRPGWFVNVDSRKMVFTDIEWDKLDTKRRNKNITDEIESLEQREISEPSHLLEIACRQLAVNAEENNRYEEAAKFRYMAMETKRLGYKWQGRLWTLNWWYRLSSGYGENWKRAGMALLVILAFFGVLFCSPLSKFDYGEPKTTVTAQDSVEKEIEAVANDAERFHSMNIGEGLVHSLYIAALQRPEPKAADTLTKFFVILETILGPLQAALLALAIRRKFMR